MSRAVSDDDWLASHIQDDDPAGSGDETDGESDDVDADALREAYEQGREDERDHLKETVIDPLRERVDELEEQAEDATETANNAAETAAKARATANVLQKPLAKALVDDHNEIKDQNRAELVGEKLLELYEEQDEFAERLWALETDTASQSGETSQTDFAEYAARRVLIQNANQQGGDLSGAHAARSEIKQFTERLGADVHKELIKRGMKRLPDKWDAIAYDSGDPGPHGKSMRVILDSETATGTELRRLKKTDDQRNLAALAEQF